MNPDVVSLVTRAFAGAAAATLVAVSARALGALTGSGAVAAIIVGTGATAAGWPWAGLLVLFFVTSTALSRAGAASKALRLRGRVAKPGARDAEQVFANGGVFTAVALWTVVEPSAIVAAAALGALAAAAGDTWATEVGTWSSSTARSILAWQPVPAGTSGGITFLGTLAGVAGAGSIAAGALTIRPGFAFFAAIATGGIAGMLADSVAGAALQAQRWCDTCQIATEQTTHDCGATTRRTRGRPWLNNDGVNALATIVGAIVAGGCASWLWPAP